jgi:hypothetical protein
MDASQTLVIRYSPAVRIAALLVTAAALAAFLPPAVRSIPLDAFGLLVLYLIPPAACLYGALFVLTYQIRIGSDGVSVEGFPNPVSGLFRCRFADLSRMEAGENFLSLNLFRYHFAAPHRIPHLDWLEGGPIRLARTLADRAPAEKFFYRVPPPLPRIWKLFSFLESAALLLISLLAAVLLLEGAGLLVFRSVNWMAVKTALSIGAVVLLLADLLLLGVSNLGF